MQFRISMAACAAMQDPGNDLTIRVPYGAKMESRGASRYHWNCHNRGPDPFVIVQVTHSGHGVFQSGKKTVSVSAGHAFVAAVPSDDQYFYPPDTTEPWVFSWINFYGSLAMELCVRFQARFGSVVRLAEQDLAHAKLMELIEGVSSQKTVGETAASVGVYEFFLTWQKDLEAPSVTPLDPMDTALAWLRSGGQRPLTVKELADRVGMSREHFSRVFAARTGMGPSAFLRRERARRAAEMLREPGLPHAEIALRCGYSGVRQLREAIHSGEVTKSASKAPQTFS